MDIFTYLMQPIAVFAFLGVAYIVIFKGKPSNKKIGHYTKSDWNFAIKKLWAGHAIRKWKKDRKLKNIPLTLTSELPRPPKDEESWDTKTFSLSNPDGSSLFASLKKRKNRITDATVILILANGTVYQLPNSPDTVYTNTSVENWSGGGLKLLVNEPFKKWRIVFNGLLSKGIQNELSNDRETIHVRFNFVWSMCHKPIFDIQDWSDTLMADSISREPWRHPQWIEMLDQWDMGGYHQYGGAMGEVYLGSDLEPITLHLRGNCVRQWAPLGSIPLRRTLTLQGITSGGAAYFLHSESYHQGLTELTHGSIRFPSGDLHVIDSCDFKLRDIGEYKSHIPNIFTIVATAGGRDWRITVNLEKHKQMVMRNGRPWDWENIIIPIQAGVNDSYGVGILHIGYCFLESSDLGPATATMFTKELKWGSETIEQLDMLCVSFDELAARCPQLVGAKAASLALLQSAPTNKYVVPPGFALTVNAMILQQESADGLLDAIDCVYRVAADYHERDMKNACERVSDIFRKTPITFKVQSKVNNYLEKLRTIVDIEVDPAKITFAVRSSGIGEDSEDLSAAGQNSTILGCRTNAEVFRAIQECWASLFSFQSVEYRRQHGQICNCGMGVVIQVVIEAQSAGVMFTRHPNNGDPSHILITSNYGLGETVVSGDVEPDTILLSRTYQNIIGIHKIEIGKKTHKVIVQKDVDGGGTHTVDLSDKEITVASVSEADCLRLGQIAIEQEAFWGAPRDIEWAVANGKIYLLQARPITNLDRWTDYELTHEIDTPIMSEDDLMSFANTGEVMPGALSPLSQNVIVKTMDETLSFMTNTTNPSLWHRECLVITHYHTGIDVINTLFRHVDDKITVDLKVMEIGVFGHSVFNDKFKSVSRSRRPPLSGLAKMAKFLDMVKTLWKLRDTCERSIYLSTNLKLNVDKCNTSEELLKEIAKSLVAISDSFMFHAQTTTGSLFSEIFAIMVLVEGGIDFTADHYLDIGKILSSSKDVVSADVPNTLSEIATLIYSTGKSTEFSKLPTSDALKWLVEHCTPAAIKFEMFLKKHGHRGIKEFDMATTTWGMDYNPILKTLQAGVSSVDKAGPSAGSTHPISSKDLVSQLLTPKKAVSRFLLRLLVPICQKAVAQRESTKEASILLIHKFRMAYLALGKKMVAEWYIPNERLVFYLTQDELQDLLKTRNPALVQKAQQRKRLLEKLDKLNFTELNEGFPQPLNAETDTVEYREGSTDSRIIGTPVYPGKIIGRACVVQHLSEAGQIENGDILIARSTDIGWSPYFPLLGGVVTELGGLISHGAVVAREYGLPCVVGAQGATSFFKTGDTVRLVGAVGYIERMEPAP